MAPVILPSTIRLVESSTSTRYILPKRHHLYILGPLSFILLGLLFAGALPAAFAWGIGAGGIFNPHRPFDATQFAIALVLALPFMALGLALIFLAVISFFPFHCEITLAADKLTVTNCNGPWRRRHRRPLNALARLRVTQVHASRSSRNDDDDQPTDDRFYIQARFNHHPAVDIGIGYPRDLLISLANDLAERCALSTTVEIAQPARAKSPQKMHTPAVIVEPLCAHHPAAPETPLPQPAHGTASLVQDGSTATILFPPAGFTGAATPLIIAAALAAFIFSTLLATHTFLDFSRLLHRQDYLALFGGFASWPLCLAFLVSRFHIARRKTVFIATPDLLLYSQSSPLYKSTRQFKRSTITGITVGESASQSPPDMEARVREIVAAIKAGKPPGHAHHEAMHELRIHLQNLPTISLLTGRNPEELNWLASILRCQPCT